METKWYEDVPEAKLRILVEDPRDEDTKMIYGDPFKRTACLRRPRWFNDLPRSALQLTAEHFGHLRP
jgi:hypothetical protein